MIEFSNVTYGYSNQSKSLNNISFNVNTGERLALTGNNGSGKTTLALLINGILKSNEGLISVDGLNPSNEPDSASLKQKVGLVFQNPDNQLVSTTVEREVAFSLENRNVPQKEIVEQVYELLDSFGLYSMRKKLTSELSGGEKQRLALASVMISKPDILILDEPGSFLDESGKKMMKSAVDSLKEENSDLTLIHITQYAKTALLYRRMICLDDGCILADGDPKEIVANCNIQDRLGIEVPYEFLNRQSLKKRLFANSEAIDEAANYKSIVSTKLTYDYGDQSDNAAINNLNLTLKNSEIYGIVGKSGSGKTTTVQALAGLFKKITGSIEYDGFDKEKSPVAVAFQQAERQFFLETVDAEIRFGAENLRIANIDIVVENCYKSIGLDKDEFSKRMPYYLSGGEKRRLSFGALLAMQPSFIFFDEPTCGLDANGTRMFARLALKLRHAGIGICVISHDGDLIFNLADRVIVLDDGKMLGEYSRPEFFGEINYSAYLSEPSAVFFQKKRDSGLQHYDLNDFIQSLLDGEM